MNQEQYNIVKMFLSMGNSANRISKEFNAPLEDVTAARDSATYSQYKKVKADNMFDTLFGNMGL